MIELLLGRLEGAKKLDQIVLATPIESGNALLVDHVRDLGYGVFQGSESDVLDRYYQAARAYEAHTVVRITGDCPLIDADLVDALISRFEETGADYVSNVSPPTYPDGLDAEVFSFDALQRAWRDARSAEDREHVTLFIRESGEFRTASLQNAKDYSDERWTVDEPDDVGVVESVYAHFQPRRDFSWKEVLLLSQENPDLFGPNRHLVRNDGSKLGMGQKLWQRAKRIIPGGNMLLSKRAEMFLPGYWPAYFSRARGCKIWDLDGRKYTDMLLMGVGTNILGYGHREVDDAVRATIDAGNMSTLNCAEEVYLAERLIELHPWAEMVRFARTGGEANAIAVRIARAASGRHKVAICGYHGWHDWYLAANLGDDSRLAGHLLPGLQPAGVPPTLRDTVFAFNYNRLDELEALIREHEIGVIKMEVSRNEGPVSGFLEAVRELATANGIVLIFDECTSGFRQCFGGLHKIYGVYPDLAVFGKALGNGYAITATVGRREIMEAAQSSFISSTFWTERIGPSAALKTLDVMERIRSWDIITETGDEIGKRWERLAAKHGLEILIHGLPALVSFSFKSANHLAYKTLITQEMLRQGYLAGTSVYVCTEHSEDVVEGFFAALDPIFAVIKECEDGRDVNSLVQGEVCHSGFRRLN